MSRAWHVGAVVVAVAGLGFARLGAAQVQPDREQTEAPAEASSPPAPPDASEGGANAPIVAEASAPPEESAPPPSSVAPAPMAVAPPPPPPEPLKRPQFGAAILQAVDKVTAETLRFEARVGEPVRYKGLVLTVRACEQTAADEQISDSVASLDVVFQPQSIPGRTTISPRPIFHGWMFASSPSLHPLEQPSYDVWVIACKAASGPGSSA